MLHNVVMKNSNYRDELGLKELYFIVLRQSRSISGSSLSQQLVNGLTSEMLQKCPWESKVISLSVSVLLH